MLSTRLYTSTSWRDLAAAARQRDGDRCTVARLLGGACSPRLHAHHLIPISEGGDPLPELEEVITVCARHHPTLEAVRRSVRRARERAETLPKRCPHPPGSHPYPGARAACERRLNRSRIEAA